MLYETRDFVDAMQTVAAADKLSMPFTVSWPVDGKYMIYVNEDKKVEDRPTPPGEKALEIEKNDQKIGFTSD